MRRGRMVLSRWLALAALVLSALVPYTLEQDEDIPHNEVKNWALKFGVDLWEFGRQFTKMNEIQRKYQDLEVQVTRKDGLILIREMAQEVKNMMEIKMSALTRLMEAAEQSALAHKFDRHSSLSYVNSRRLSDFFVGAEAAGGPADGGGRGRGSSSSEGEGDGGARGDEGEVSLVLDPHFGFLPVNSNFSCVLLPSGVHDRASDVRNAIKWSEYLDQVFVGNYELDPTLTWQYFGSAQGFIRRYPANKWPVGTVSSDDQDFRTAPWYLSAATSPKDLVVLVDASGSMSGSRRDLARATASAILDTLGPDDFVNVLRFADTTESIVPCFKDILVQGNRANIRELRNALDSIKPENIANFSSALITAFELLHKYNRTGQGSQCNQAIMIITDGAPHSFREIFKQYNWPHMPVRVFTYLVGKDAVNAPDLNWMACANKGYFMQIGSSYEVRDKVLQYIEVMARPMVMYQNDHPIQWSPVFADTKGGCLRSTGNSCPEYQLMTSVSTPIFDRRNYSVRVANLLGVVGLDVPIQQIKKLVPPYKLGVNGYSFIVDNNGNVLYHPDLRPLLKGSNRQNSLRPEASGVDLTEVELIDNGVSHDGDKGSRENKSLLLDMRHEMIDQKEGEAELNVKVHCDNMRRVTTRRQKYFYHPIEGTQFSLGVALPDGYGIYEVQGEEEIKHSPVNVTEYFKGSNWKVHPDWVYCEYNHETDHAFHTPEEQVLHFIARTRKPGWKWMSLRPRSPQRDKELGHNNLKKMERDSYFCDKTLLQSLVFDALVTEGLERSVSSPIKEDKQQGYQMFGVTKSFIATRSGLLRWQDHKETNSGRGGTPVSIGEEIPDGSSNQFGEGNRRAIDEVWYKRAVEQYAVEPDSFVFTVNFDAGDAIMSGDQSRAYQTLVTATHAVFVEYKGYRAPAAVVGLQFKHTALASQFLNITSTCLGPLGCRKTCASEELDCYVLDSNGFVILSEEASHTGKFFGEIDGTIMDSLVQDRIYRKVGVWDHQGACTDDHSPFSDASCRLTPPSLPFHGVITWALSRISWLAIYIGLPQIWYPFGTEAQPTGDDISDLTEDEYDSYDDEEEEEEGEVEEEEEEEEENGGGGEGEEVENGVGGGSSALPPPPPPVALPPPPPPPPLPTSATNHSSHWREGGGGGGWGSGSSGWGNQHYPRKWPQITQTTYSGGQGSGSDARPCNKRTDLYILQPERLNTSGLFNPLKGKLTNCHVTGCERPFSVQKIPHSNLILLVVDTLCPCGSKLLSIVPREVVAGAGASVSGAIGAGGSEVPSPSSSPSMPPASSPANGGSGGSHCPRPKDTLYRRRPPKCMNYHPEESEIRLCGGSGSLRPTAALVSAIVTIWSTAMSHFWASISS